MKYPRFMGGLFSLLALPFAMSGAVENANSNGGVPASFATADAWNIVVKTNHVFPSNPDSPTTYSIPRFSHDFRRLLYCEFRPVPHRGQFYQPHEISIVIRSLETWAIVKRVVLPIDNDSGGAVAFSPDEKKVVFGPVIPNLSSGTNMFFIDLATSKAIGVRLNRELYGQMLEWPNPTNVYVLGGEPLNLNLDTLELSNLSGDVKIDPIRNYQVSQHPKCVIRVNQSRFIKSGGFLEVANRNDTYSRVLHEDLPSEDDRWNDGWIIWSPDLQYVIFWKRHFASSTPPCLLHLGLRATPALDFEVKGLELTPDRLQQFKKASTGEKRIVAAVYGSKINPLTNRLLGPDEEKFRGIGYVTQIESTFRFRYAFEYQPAESGNVASGFWEKNEIDWGRNVWGQLASVTNSGDAATSK